MQKSLKNLKNLIYSNWGLATLVVIFVLSLGIAFIDWSDDSSKLVKTNLVESTELNNSPDETSVSADNSTLPKSNPARLLIPKLDIDTDFEDPLGLFSNGEVEVPNSYTKVGWYKYGPTPGELGPAVILGHVDSYQGPAVFFYLGQLVEGDDIYIERNDGETAHFKVTKLERYEQVEFPATKVYGDIDHAGLRLITCSGIFNRGNQRYSHNLVVYAKLVE